MSMPISLVRLEDSSQAGLTHMFLCCYVDTRIRVYDFEELMAVIVPPQFTLQGTVFSYRLQDEGEGTMPHSGSLTDPISLKSCVHLLHFLHSFVRFRNVIGSDVMS